MKIINFEAAKRNIDSAKKDKILTEHFKAIQIIFKERDKRESQQS